ncbi:putative glycerol-3-phosphate transporter 5 [Magnolia sinica]|uniref:putative glycerol-3-phosphate transporter 5 n=1 Tax=Magnolia sinica TaxID=86752 RepID=UPI002658511F|nr:putative glycerol-3-phosphate transporter 5 [Magnolia sinica]
MMENSQKSLVFYQISVFTLTFLAYASFHASRKPPSIVKSALTASNGADNSTQAHEGWPPFNGPDGPHRLGQLDLAFLISYSISMFFSGQAADRVDLRLFLSFGMIGSAISTVAFGLAFWFKIHRLLFFLAVQIVCGVFQSMGWPAVVAIVGNWFGRSKRGLIMGVWNSHTSIGNIVGSVIASSVLEFGWGWSFVGPGCLIGLVGISVFVFLVANPEDVGFELPRTEIEMTSDVNIENGENPVRIEGEEEEGFLVYGQSLDSTAAIGFFEAWRLPGVAPYAFCLFFSKLVAYTFLYWLPFYISKTAVSGKYLSHKDAGILSTIFDLGGVLGGISAGYISDKIEARAVTSVTFFLFSIPALILYRVYGSVSIYTNIGLMFLSGLFVNGPYSLITTAVATDLGTQSVIKGNSRALATVSAIIDGTGSIGAALGPLLTGYILTRGWNSVFAMLIVAIFLAGLFLIHLVKAEIKSKMSDIR